MTSVDQSLDAVRPGTEPLPGRRRQTPTSRLDLRFTRAARAISVVTALDAVRGPRYVRVRCWSRADWQRELRRFSVYVGRRMRGDSAAFVVFPRDINLGPRVCAALDDLAYGQDRPKSRAKIAELATGVVMLAYEIQFLEYPRASTAVHECYAIQALRQTAEAIGVDITYSPTLLRVYYRDVYPHLPAAYHSPECHRGGRLDLDILYTWP